MNIYVETNFVLELTFEQEQYSSCEQILQLCEVGKAKLIVPDEEEQQRFIQCHDRFLQVGEIIALNAIILREAASYETTYDLTPQDALVYASVITHLQHDLPEQACFLNRNSKDFDSPNIIDELRKLNCRMIPRFDRGYSFIQSHLSSE